MEAYFCSLLWIRSPSLTNLFQIVSLEKCLQVLDTENLVSDHISFHHMEYVRFACFHGVTCQNTPPAGVCPGIFRFSPICTQEYI